MSPNADLFRRPEKGRVKFLNFDWVQLEYGDQTAATVDNSDVNEKQGFNFL